MLLCTKCEARFRSPLRLAKHEASGCPKAEPRAYLTLSGGKTQVIDRGCAVAQGERADMLAYFRKHYPKVSPIEFRPDGTFAPGIS